jgi:hypothetical protein
MIEINSIIIQFLLFVFLSYFPINKFTFPKISNVIENSNYNIFFLNIAILLLIFLIFSFTSIKLRMVFITIISIYIILFLFNFLKIFKEIFSVKNIELKLLFCAINLFIFFNTANKLSIGFDGLLTWIFKVNNFYLDKNYFNLFYEKTFLSNYPHLGSYAWAFFWKNSIIQKEYLGRLFYDYIYILSLFVLVDSFKILSGVKKLSILLILILFTYQQNFNLEGYQEYLMFALLIFCSKIFLLIIENKNSKSYVLFLSLILIMILIPWIKNEGVFYSLFFNIIFLKTKESLKRKIILSSIIFMSIAVQILIVKYLFSANSFFDIPFEKSNILGNLNIKEFVLRCTYISFYILHSFLKYPLILFNFFILFCVIKHRSSLIGSHYLLLFLFLNLIFLYSIYIFTHHEIIWHLKTSLRRLLFQTSGIYFFIFVEMFNKGLITEKFYEKIKNKKFKM